MIRRLLPAAAACVLAMPLAYSQEAPERPSYSQSLQPNTDIRVDKVNVNLVESPVLQSNVQAKRSGRPLKFLEIEVDFQWQPNNQVLRYYSHLDDLKIRYFVLLNNEKVSPQAPNGNLLVGEVDHVLVAPGRGLRSVMYVAPRALDKLFGGRIPNNANQAIKDAGVEIIYDGKVVAWGAMQTTARDESQNWWKNPALGDITLNNILLNKNQTPFAHLNWDAYEPIKPEGSGNR